ncbi:hypothetical protein FNO01nite_04200 [Flavobacterium noncentrifugens]|uniref:hypothetical protein n=1 Tax=Flavobacterium noncentrifugens TaxID=1128970 RepID=UPI001191156B|nr:hypothetical protein [Flavobacterium noncentrifugens]GEP49748.1 hypothetical protein FNO01nite_04200 [Flavobacterium noncentrifugens]
MKKKFSIFNFSLIAAVLFAILFQSLHSVEHFTHEQAERKCYHSHETGSEQITHQHHNFDHCFACDFTFSNFVTPEIFSFDFVAQHRAIPYFLTVSETLIAFSGSSVLLRGPPVFIV